MLKKIFKLFTICLLVASLLQNISCNASSPPVSIPVTVAGLISIATSDTNTVRILGQNGAVSGSATVTVSSSGTTLSTITADGNGALPSTTVTAAIGDTLSLVQTSNGQTATAVTFTVLNGRFALDNTPQGTSSNNNNNGVCTVEQSGTDSILTCYTLDGLTIDISETLTGFLAAGVASGNSDGTYIVDSTNSDAQVRTTSGAQKSGDLSFPDSPQPVVVATNPDSDFAVMGLTDGSASVRMIENNTSPVVLGPTLNITHPSTGSAHVSTYAIAADLADTVNRFACLSSFANGDNVVSVVTGTAPPAEALALGSQVNLGSGTFGGISMDNNGQRIIVSDTANDRVILLTGAGFATQNTISLASGASPRGLAVDETENNLYVANSGNNTVSVINLSTETLLATLTTQNGVGLNPTNISLGRDAGSNPFIVVANLADNSLSILDVSTVGIEGSLNSGNF